jgi:hypothetical protein
MELEMVGLFGQMVDIIGLRIAFTGQCSHSAAQEATEPLVGA